MAISLCGCGQSNEESTIKNTDIVIAEELKDGEIFRLDDLSCTIPEANVFMHTSQDQYTSVFGEQILDEDIDGKSLSEQLKDTTLARLAQIKAITLLARSMDITLSETQEKAIADAANEYISSLSDQEIKTLEVNTEIIAELYREYALSTLCYNEITKDVNPEVSDDDARAVTVKHILIKTYSKDSNGNVIKYTPSQKADAQYLAGKVLSEIRAGNDFDQVCEKYNEDEKDTYSFCKGEMPEEYEKVAFSLDTDEISGIVETDYGYHIIKCLSTLDREATDINKEKIVQQKKDEAFNEVYDAFIKTIYSNINQELWDGLKFESNPEVDTVDFFDVYNKYDIGVKSGV